MRDSRIVYSARVDYHSGVVTIDLSPILRLLVGTGLVMVLNSSSCLAAAGWPQFRGPDGQGIGLDRGLPTTWSADSNLVWRIPLPGPGGSSPVIGGDLVFVTCYTGYAVPGDVLGRDVTQPIAAHPGMQDALITVYRQDAKNAELCERLVDLDEGLQEWRYRHVKMVQRTIGALPGTGGSSGAQYLSTTLMQPLFPDLWEIRARL